jgi:hypothetical protein
MKSIAKASLVAAFLGVGITAVAAQPSVAPPTVPQIQSDNVLQAMSYKKYKKEEYKKHKKYKKWVWRHNGNRFRHRRPGYLYFYDGWWYPRPYWRSEPGITINLGL